MVQNKGLIFKQVPHGWPVAGQDLAVESRDFDPEAAPPAGGLTTRNFYCSFDPYQRGRLRDAAVKSYSPAYPLGRAVTNWGIARVLKSDCERFAAGDLIVSSEIGIEEYSAIPGDRAAVPALAYKLPALYPSIDPKHFLGALGMPGLTAWASLHEIGKPKKGETIFVSSAAGPVGQAVGQIAKHEGLRVIGSVGSDAKLELITERLAFDGGFNYKTEKPAAALKRLAPDGIDIYYENVGGEQLEAALDAMNWWGRIVACGMISQYNAKADERYGVPNLTHFIAKRLTMRGFIVSDKDFGPKYAAEHQRVVGQWIAEGSFKPEIDVVEGIDRATEGLLGIFKGENFGKAMLKVADLDVGAGSPKESL